MAVGLSGWKLKCIGHNVDFADPSHVEQIVSLRYPKIQDFRRSDEIVDMCGQYVLRRVGLPLNISVSIHHRKTFGACIILRADICNSGG